MLTRIHPITYPRVYDSAYSALVVARDDNVYFGLCTHMPGKSAGFFRYSPKTSNIEQLFSVADISPQGYSHGKIHTPIAESADGILYFATHFAYPYGIPQAISYEGGRLFAYNPSTSMTEDLGIVQKGNGVITLTMDTVDNLIYLLTIPDGRLYRYTVATRQYVELGTIPSESSVARSIAIDKDGNVYGTYEKNGVFVFRKATQFLEFLPSSLGLPEQGSEWNSASRGGVNKLSRYMWRYASYDEKRNTIYGIHSSKAAIFSLNCDTLGFQVLGSLTTNNESRRIDSEIYPTLSFTGNDNSLYYASATGLFDYCRSEYTDGWSHLLQFDKTKQRVQDKGVMGHSGRKVYGASAAVSTATHVYFLGAVTCQENETYNTFNVINQAPFQLGLVEVKL